LAGQAPPPSAEPETTPPPWQTLQGSVTAPPPSAAGPAPWGDSAVPDEAPAWEEPAITPVEPSAEDMAWLGAFGQAAGYDMPAPSEEQADDDWLTAAPQAEAPAETVAEEEFGWLADDAFADPEQPEPQAEAPAEPVAEEEFGWLADDAFADLEQPEPQAEAPAEPVAEEESGWLADDAFADLEQPEPRAEAPAEPVAEEEFGWLADNALGDVPVLASQEPPEPEESGEDLPDWLGSSPFDEGAPPAGVGDSGSGSEPPDWLDLGLEEPEEPEEEQPSGAGVPDWVLNPEETPAEEPPPAGIRRIRPAEEKPSSGIRRIRPQAEEPAPEPEPHDEMEGLTYEEWEQRQIEQEREAQKTPEDRLLEEVPEWFDELESEGAPEEEAQAEEAPKPGGPEFVPGWFLGLEDQDEEAAPDWFQQLDYSPDAVTQPPEAPAAPEFAPPSADEAPDWFKGVDVPEVEGMDWSAFGAPGDQGEPEKRDWFPAPEPEEAAPDEMPLPDLDWMDAPEPEPGSEEESAPDWMPEAEATPDEMPLPDQDWMDASEPEPGSEEEPAPDWMAEEQPEGALPSPDFDALTGEELPVEEGKVPDWLAAAAPGADVMAEPDEVPFPDLDLDQPMPAASAEAEIDALMEGFLPEKPVPSEEEAAGPEIEDFVERFEPLEPAEYATPPVDEEAPAWLREMGEQEGLLAGEPARTEIPAEEVEYAPPDEGLDWLSAISPADSPAPEEPEAWDAGEPEAEPEPALAPQDRLDSASIDDLLSLYAPAEEAAPPEEEWPASDEEAWPDLAEEPGVEEVFGTPTEPETLPDLEALFAEAEAEGEAAEMPGEPEPPVMPEAERPEWVEEMRPSDVPVTVRGGGAEKSVRQKQVIDLPERVRLLREAALEEAPQPEPEPVPDSGPLAGIEGALPLVSVMLGSEQATAPARGPAVTREQRARAAKLQALLDMAAAEEESGEPEAEYKPFSFDEEEPATAEPRVRPRRRARFKPDRLLVSLVLLIGLLVPFATDVLHFAADPAPLGGDRQAAAEAVDTLQPGQYALFAFEYGPTAAGELDALAEAVLRDVLAQGAVPLTISTNPAGAFHAQAVLARLADDEALLAARGTGEERLIAGEDYVTLSYLSGEATGVRLLAATYETGDGTPKVHPAFDADLRGDDTGLMITSLEKDIALIAVVGEGSEDVRVWAEQLNGVAVPKVALVTAAMEPVTVPYVNEDAYAGYLAGYRDTISYNADRNAASRAPYTMPEGVSVDIPNPEEARWHSMALGAALAAGLIALGMVVNLFRVLIRRPRR
ncbi:MAG: hypothetical protein JW910_05025, partial [Anaerolineae bacterium]|nr:hypothetical protein [Anaerolineae bacterium]